MRINRIVAQNDISMDVVEKYNSFLKEKLLIIGDVEGENMTIFLSDRGTFYGCFDDCILNWGYKFECMLFKLINGIRGALTIID